MGRLNAERAPRCVNHRGARPCRSAVEPPALHCGQECRSTRVRNRQHATKGGLTVSYQKTLFSKVQLYAVSASASTMAGLAPFPSKSPGHPDLPPLAR
jgi:hypothetical protein